MTFVWVGASVAPKHALRTATALLALWIAIAIAIVACVSLYGSFGPLENLTITWFDAVRITGGVCGAFAGYYLLSRQLQAEPSDISLDTEEPPTLTPETAEPILDIVSEALQQDDGMPFHPRSSLKGHDVFQVDVALKLRTANDLLLLATQGREAELDDRAMQVETIPQHVAMQFVEDSELNKLRSVPRKSPEYMRLQMEIMPDTLRGAMDSKLGKLELLSPFAKYCRHVGAKDPLYWQKIYSRLNVPYCKVCPRGNDPVWL